MEVRITVDTQGAEADMLALQRLLADMTPIMRGIALELVSQTEENFESEGRPSWPTLADSTRTQRAKQGKWPGQILQVSGALARGVSSRHDTNTAEVGVSGVPYAAIQQLGGNAGRGRNTRIPARPYLPIVGGKLQPDAEEAIIDIIKTKITQVAGG